MLEYFPKSNSNVCLVFSDKIKQCKLMIKLVSYGGYASVWVIQLSCTSISCQFRIKSFHLRHLAKPYSPPLRRSLWAIDYGS